MTQSGEIPTSDAEPIRTTGWKWVAACALSMPAGILLAIPLTVAFGSGSQMGAIAFAPAVLVLFPWVFGLRNDVKAVHRADVAWNPGFLRYVAASVLLSPYVSAAAYTVQRYRKIGFDSTLPP